MALRFFQYKQKLDRNLGNQVCRAEEMRAPLKQVEQLKTWERMTQPIGQEG